MITIYHKAGLVEVFTVANDLAIYADPDGILDYIKPRLLSENSWQIMACFLPRSLELKN